MPGIIPQKMTPQNTTKQEIPPQDMVMEICVDSIDLVHAAIRGGADRIELCGPLHDGGITPSAGLAVAARQATGIPIAMLIRPRTGPFTASDAEFEVMRQDILFARNLGMDIAVIGLLHENRTVDIERTRQLVELAHPMQVTFHRAFDVTPNLHQALEDVLQTGATRILTSGAKPTAVLGSPIVGDLRQVAANRIGMLLCGGISSATARQSIQRSGVHEIHAALRSSIRFKPSSSIISPENLQLFSESVAKLKEKMLEAGTTSPSLPEAVAAR